MSTNLDHFHYCSIPHSWTVPNDIAAHSTLMSLNKFLYSTLCQPCLWLILALLESECSIGRDSVYLV